MTAKELRLKAAQIMRERGHAKGVAEGYFGGVCMGGALILAFYGRVPRKSESLNNFWAHPDYGAYEVACAEIGNELGIAPKEIPEFNDYCDRTAEECIRALEGPYATPTPAEVDAVMATLAEIMPPAVVTDDALVPA